MVIREFGEDIYKGKKVNRMQKTLLQASKCHSSDSIRVGVRPLDINFKN